MIKTEMEIVVIDNFILVSFLDVSFPNNLIINYTI